MLNLTAIALGGALGALGRYGLGTWIVAMVGRDFPYATLTINVIGSFLMGLAYMLVIDKLLLGHELRDFIVIGLLGAFTTFSTFSIETLLLIHEGHITSAFVYVGSSIIICLIAVWLGLLLGRQF